MKEISPITVEQAKEVLDKQTEFRGPFNVAIAVREQERLHGVIALQHDGIEIALAHLWTDANAQVGSLLYGAAWRVAKALGYKRIWI